MLSLARSGVKRESTVARYLRVHQDNPQQRLIAQAVDELRKGALMVYPTDSCYALGCRLGDKDALERLCRVRDIDPHHHFTLVCSGLSELARYANVNNVQYRLLRMATPGSYTFVLKANRDVPRRVMHERRKTVGLRVPDHAVAIALLEELGEPILSSTLILPGEELPPANVEDVKEYLDPRVDLILDSGSCGIEMTTVVDLSGEVPQLIRSGKGSLKPFGLETGE